MPKTKPLADGAGRAIDRATLDFLRWVAGRTASYQEAWEVWQTTCPRHSTWDDSFIEGYVCTERRPDRAKPVVVLTALGRSILDGAA